MEDLELLENALRAHREDKEKNHSVSMVLARLFVDQYGINAEKEFDVSAVTEELATEAEGLTIEVRRRGSELKLLVAVRDAKGLREYKEKAEAAGEKVRSF